MTAAGGAAPSSNRRSREPDLAAVQLVARGRVLLATAAVLTASVVPWVSSGKNAVLYLLGLFWVPWSGFIAIHADRGGARITRLSGAAGDLAVLFAVGWLLPDMTAVVGLGCVAVVLVVAYGGGWREGAMVSAGALAIVVSAARGESARSPSEPAVIALLVVVLVLLLLVVERGNAQQRRAARESERLVGRSGAVLARVADGVVVTDTAGTVLEANPAAGRIVACAETDLVGRHCGEVLGLGLGERRLDCRRGCELLILGEGKGGELGHEVWRTSPDGRRQPLLANVAGITNPDGDIDEVVHSLRDITSIKQADEAKTLFLATASHELKTPLTVIRGFADVLLQSPDVPDEVRVDALQAIVRRAVELGHIVDRLLLSSRIEAGRLQLEMSAVELGPILEEVGSSLQAATGQTIEVVISPDLPSVEADAAAVTTVVEHLLDNAVKYSPDGSIVTLRAEAERDRVDVRVTDSGIGMDSVQAAHCFDKFWQAESTDARRFTGSGIGLYIVRSLVEAMGGTIEIDTTPGRGTTFSVGLRPAGLGEHTAVPSDRPGIGEASIVREFMRQIGIADVVSR